MQGASPETDIVKWTFKDGTEQEVKQEEHSVQPFHAACSSCLYDVQWLIWCAHR